MAEDDHQDPDELIVALRLLVLEAVDQHPQPEGEGRQEEGDEYPMR
jgi:hypothetical protein